MKRVVASLVAVSSLVLCALFLLDGPQREPTSLSTVNGERQSVDRSTEVPTPEPPQNELASEVPPAAPSTPAFAKPGSSSSRPFPLELDLDTVIRGRLVDTVARPLVDVEVYAQIGLLGSARLKTESGEYEHFSSWASPTVSTDPKGDFEIAGLDARGFHSLFVEPPEGFMAKRVEIGRPPPGEVTDLGSIVLEPAFQLTVTVTDANGYALEGAVVTVAV
jgi:hypothetical protein